MTDSVQELVAQLLHTLGIEAQIGVSEGPRKVIALSSDDSKLLIGPHGEHLSALNALALKLVEMKHGEEAANFLIDVNGYHEAQLETLRESARLLAQRARLFKHDVEMSPMSSYERLVIHELFSADPEIKTESAGEGKTRHIVLKYKSSESSGAGF